MDMHVVGIHIHELRNQCRYIEASVAILNQSLEGQHPVGIFFSLQNIMLGTHLVSRLLWTTRKRGKARADALREMLKLPAKHPLNNPNILTLVDHADEASDQWISQSKDQYILYDFIGDIANSPHKDVKPENIYRAFDTSSKIYSFRGVGYNLEALLKALSDISNRVNQIHKRLYPDQWKAEEAEEAARLKAEAEKDQPTAKPDAKKTPKKPAAKKPAVKKATPKKTTPKKASPAKAKSPA